MIQRTERKLLLPGKIEAMAIFDSKISLDIKNAEIRARKCGCRNCHRNAQRMREWGEDRR